MYTRVIILKRFIPDDCDLDCPLGRVIDEKGRELCECAEPDRPKCPSMIQCQKNCVYGYKVKLIATMSDCHRYMKIRDCECSPFICRTLYWLLGLHGHGVRCFFVQVNRHGCPRCRCNKCPAFFCKKKCQYGYQQNNRGCKLCKCNSKWSILFFPRQKYIMVSGVVFYTICFVYGKVLWVSLFSWRCTTGYNDCVHSDHQAAQWQVVHVLGWSSHGRWRVVVWRLQEVLLLRGKRDVLTDYLSCAAVSQSCNTTGRLLSFMPRYVFSHVHDNVERVLVYRQIEIPYFS